MTFMGDLTQLLRTAGYRVTPARRAVLSTLAHEGKPLSLRRLVEKARAQRAIDPVTVYRTILSLDRAGIVRRVDFRHGHAHYELANREEHHHCICVRCDRVEDVTGCRVSGMTSRVLRETGFETITEHALEFFGICRACARQPQ